MMKNFLEEDNIIPETPKDSLQEELIPHEQGAQVPRPCVSEMELVEVRDSENSKPQEIQFLSPASQSHKARSNLHE